MSVCSIPLPASALPNFTIVLLPDTQNYTGYTNNNGGYPAEFDAQTAWIDNYRTAFNIVYVTQVGDISNAGDTYESEWLNATNAMYALETPLPGLPSGIPYGVAVGNHDESPMGSFTGTTKYYNKYFGVPHFSGRAYYGGHYGSNNDNHYDFFTVNGVSYIVVYIKYGVSGDTSGAVLNWASNVLTTYANRKAIVVCHGMLSSGSPAPWLPDGQYVYDGLKTHQNIFLMLCGHWSRGWRQDTYQGNTITTMMSDYQGYSEGGYGYLWIMTFAPYANSVLIRTYSPYHNVWLTGPSDEFSLLLPGVPSPFITNQPPSQKLAAGQNAVFNVGAGGAGPLSYQWKFNQTNLSGATATTCVISNVQPANAGWYSVTVTNAYGSTFTDPVMLSVVPQLTNAAGAILAPSGLADWWPAEGNPNDIFGTNNGTPVGGFSYVAGEQGLGFHFDGATGYLKIGAPTLPAPWTACFWVNRQNATGVSAGLMSDGTNYLKLEQYNTARQVGVTILGKADYTFGYTAQANVWTHLAFVNTGSQMQLYTNGHLQGTLSVNLPLPRAYMGVDYIGSTYQLTDYLAGSLDETLVFNRALNASEISAIHSAAGAGLVRAPEFTGVNRNGGPWQWTLRGQTGKTFTLYSSTNLTDWTPLGALSNPTGTLQYTNPMDLRVQFFRASQP